MRIVGYLRVSTEGQARDGLGLDVQERAIRAWAKAHGHRVIGTCADEGVSGLKELEQRMALAEALELVRRGAAEGVAVYRLDRLARDLVVQEQLLAEFWRAGAEVFSTASGEGDLRDDPEDPSRKLIRQMLGAVAEYERAMTVLRLRRGRARKAELGGYAYGAPAFGYRSEERALVEVAGQQATVARIVELADAGKSLRQVAAVLEQEGRRPRRGDRWHPQTVGRALSRARAAVT